MQRTIMARRAKKTATLDMVTKACQQKPVKAYRQKRNDRARQEQPGREHTLGIKKTNFRSRVLSNAASDSHRPPYRIF